MNLNANSPAVEDLRVNKTGPHGEVSPMAEKGLLAKRILQDAPHQRFPTESDELSLEEQIGFNLVKSPGKNVLGRKKGPQKGLGEKEHFMQCTHFIYSHTLEA